MTNPVTVVNQKKPKPTILSVLQPFTVARYHWLIVLLAYTILTLIITYPIIFNLDTTVLGHIPNSDNLQNIWDLWWFQHALESGHNPNYTNFLFGLLPKVQIFVWTFINAIVAWPLHYFLSYLALYNLLILSSFMLTGFCMYLLAGLFLENKFACFVAGFLFDFSTFHFARAEGHLGLVTMEVLPFCAWALFLFYRKPTLKRATLAGIGLALVPLTDAYYLAYFGIPFGLLFFFGILATDFRWLRVRQHLLLGAVALSIALILAAPMLISFIMVDPSVQATAKTVADSSTEQLSADLMAYLLPNYTNPLFGSLTTPVFNKMLILGEKDLFFGYATLFLVLGTFLFRRNRSRIALFWLILAIVTTILSFGPKLYVGGQLGLGLPFYKLLYGWSPLSTFRAPDRMAPVPLMGLALLAGFTVNALLQQPFTAKIKWKLLIHAGLALLMVYTVAESIIISFPFPTVPVGMPSLYNTIAQDKEDGLVLDLPPFYHPGGYMYYQVYHGKKIVSGYPPRITPEMYGSVSAIPYMAPFMYVSLTENAPLKAEDIFLNNDNNEFFKSALRDRHITYVILHKPVELTPAEYNWMLGFLKQNLGTPFYNNSEEELLAWHIDSSVASDKPKIGVGTGWQTDISLINGKAERVITQNGQIVVDLPGAETPTLTLKALSYFKPINMNILVNGEVKNTTLIKQAFVPQDVTIPALNLKAGRNIIEIQSADGCFYAKDFDKNNLDPRCLSIGVQEVLFENLK